MEVAGSFDLRLIKLQCTFFGNLTFAGHFISRLPVQLDLLPNSKLFVYDRSTWEWTISKGGDPTVNVNAFGFLQHHYLLFQSTTCRSIWLSRGHMLFDSLVGCMAFILWRTAHGIPGCFFNSCKYFQHLLFLRLFFCLLSSTYCGEGISQPSSYGHNNLHQPFFLFHRGSFIHNCNVVLQLPMCNGYV